MAFGVVVLLLAFVLSSLLTPLVRDAASRRQLFDHATTSRKVHGRPIPRVGGVAIVLAFYAAITAALPLQTEHVAGADARQTSMRTGAFLAGGLLIFLIGLYDDLKGAGAKQKFTAQFAVAFLLYAAGFRVDVIANPFGEAIALGWLSLPLTVVWISGVINAMNLIDGLDGLAGGVALAAAAMMVAVSLHTGDTLGTAIAAALAGSVVGFLIYNFHPASIFMGDTGSMFLGYVLATSAIQPRRGTGEVELVGFIVALGLPIADTLAAMLRRALRGVPLFVADREHIQHRLLDLGLTPRQSCLLLWSLAVLLAGAGMTLAGIGPGALLVAIVVAGALGLNQLGCLNLQYPAALRARRNLNLERRRAIRAAGERLTRARRVEELVTVFQDVGPALGARALWLHLDANGAGGPRIPRRLGPSEPGKRTLRTVHGLLGERPSSRSIEVEWTGERTELDRDAEIAVELLCFYVAAALRQLERTGGGLDELASPGRTYGPSVLGEESNA
jgi:UDP-GlcNAc:undecaprenyl-phosphate/decaprenyl-phosphate GlcNAc-1-phosphate transferase